MTMYGDRQLTADRIVKHLEAAGIDVTNLDGIADVNALYEALRNVEATPPSPVDELCAELDSGTLEPANLAARVHRAALETIDRQTWTHVRQPISERIATRMLAALRNNLEEIHGQLSAVFITEAARLVDAVRTLGDVNTAGDALDRGLEATWRDTQNAAARLETIADAVTKLPDIGHGTHGLAATWFVDVNELTEVAQLPHERPDDPLGRFVAWVRAGHTLELATGETKKQRDQHIRDVKSGDHERRAREARKQASPRALAELDAFQRGLAANQM